MNNMQQQASGESDTQPQKTLKRVQFDFSPEALKRLEALKSRVDAATMAEVIQNALMIYEWMINQIDPDYLLEVQDKTGKPVFSIPAKALLQ